MQKAIAFWAAMGRRGWQAALWAAVGLAVGLGLVDPGRLPKTLWAAEKVDKEELDRGAREVVEGLKQLLAQQAQQAAQSTGQAPGQESKPEAQPKAETKKLLAQPKPEEIRQAEKAVEEVFGRDLSKARSTQEKTTLAGEILKTAREEKDPATRWVLAQRAKQLAVQAQDAKLAVLAAEMLAQFEPPGGPISAKEAASRAHGLWAKGDFSRGPERLARWTEAAELYLRALDDLEGFEKAIAERRLKELGWSKYLPLEKVKMLFGIKNAREKDDHLEIVFTDIDKWETRIFSQEPIVASDFEFSFEMMAKWYHSLALQIDGETYWFSVGHWYNEGLLIMKGDTPLLEQRPGLSVRDPDQWCTLSATVKKGILRFSYNGTQIFEKVISSQGPCRFLVGFGSHNTTAKIRHVFLAPLPPKWLSSNSD